MATVTLTEFRSRASGMFSRVERGETLVVIRYGRPIAEVSPYGIYGRSEGARRSLALRGMVRMSSEAGGAPDAALSGRYRQLLEGARNDDERKLILGALGGVAHPEALGLALTLLETPGVREEAATAVRRMAEALAKSHPEAASKALARLGE